MTRTTPVHPHPVRSIQATRQKGFSLLELMVAFTIMAMSLGLIYKAMGGNARAAAELGTRQQALMLADSLLQTRESVTRQGWSETGTHGPYTWQVRTELFNAASAEIPSMHQLTVVVNWTDGAATRQIVAQTLLPERKPYPGEPVQ